MKIKITSDSTCDLSADLVAQNDITLLSLTVIKGGEQFLDGITIRPADIFAHVAETGQLCSTTAMNLGEYLEVFEKYTKDYDYIFHISLGSGFSSSHQNACLAAEEFPNVRVIDSKNLSTGQGLVVLKACELAKTCTDADEMERELNDFTNRVEASFVLDQLDYMVKGGRCSTVAALGANLLSLKPCIEVKDGKMGVVKKYRGSYAKCLSAYIKDRLANREDIDKNILFVTRTSVDDETKATVEKAVEAYGDFNNTYWTEAGCTVTCHCGPNTLGVLFVRK